MFNLMFMSHNVRLYVISSFRKHEHVMVCSFYNDTLENIIIDRLNVLNR
jgi:hypothetical protein